MIDTFFERRPDTGGKFQKGAANAAELLEAAVHFSGASDGKLVYLYDHRMTVYASARVDGGERDASFKADERLDARQKTIVSQTLSGGNLFRCGHSGVSTLCVPITSTTGMCWALYLEARQEGEGFSNQVVAAIELFAKTLQCLLNTEAYNITSSSHDTGGNGHEHTLIGQSSCLSRIDPSVLAGVAESIAIEISNSLSAVVAHAGAGLQWLNQETPKVEQARQSLRKIASSSFAIGATISGYSLPSRAKAQTLDAVDLHGIIASALNQLAPTLREAEVRTDCNLSGGSQVFAAAREIEQAIVNLISIAADATQKTSHERKISLSTARQDKYLVLSISDTGPSIPVEARDAIFDPSYTTKQGNRGIKLAIARTIAQLHGGNLDIARSNDDGTTMLLRLPANISTDGPGNRSNCGRC